MSAFGNNYRFTIVNNIRGLYQRRLQLSRLALTYDEYINTFVPPEARQLFRSMAPYNGCTSYVRGELDLNQFGHDANASLHIRSDHKHKFAPPLVRGLELQPDAPPEVVERFKHWLENGGDVHRDFARVVVLFTRLSESYSRSAIRHYWPTIMALCDGHEDTKHLIQELQVMKAPPAPKPLPPGWAAACRKTAATISTAQLIPAEVEGREIDEVLIQVNSGQKYTEEGLGTFFGTV